MKMICLANRYDYNGNLANSSSDDQTMTTILVIEDDELIREDLLFLLEQSGYEAIGAPDGTSGIEAAHLHLPDLILCDIMMPDISGHNVLKTLQQSAKVSRIPFIFMTALADREDVRAGMALGADDYITKPFSHEELLHAIQARLKRHTELELHRLRRYTQQFIIRQESERERLARRLLQEVHDMLGGLRLTLAAGKLPPAVHADMQRQAHATVDAMIRTIEGIAQDLHPTIVNHLGLLPALLWLLERYRQTSLRIYFKHMGLDKPLDATVSYTVFRIVQDALQEVLEYAETSTVTVQLARQAGVLHLQIQNDGKGLDLTRAMQQEVYSGLVGIYERVTALTGTVNAITTEDNGTTLVCTIPVAGYEEPSAGEKHDRVLQIAQSLPAVDVVQPLDTSFVIRVAVVAGAVVRAGVNLLLSQDDRFAVVTEADDLNKTSQRLATDKADVVLINPYGLDHLPHEVVYTLAMGPNSVPILVYSPWIEKNYVVDMLAAGAMGVVAQQATIDELVNALQTVCAGEWYLPQGISKVEIDTLLQAYQEDDIDIEVYQTLTAREKEIFGYIAEGMTNAAIAHHLTISVRTVETHRANLLRKLGLAGAHEVVRYALRIGVIS